MGPVCPGLLEEESRRVRVSSRMGDSEAIGWSDVRERSRATEGRQLPEAGNGLLPQSLQKEPAIPASWS